MVNAEIFAMPFPEKAEWQKSNDRINFYRINITKPKYNGSIAISERPVLVVSNINFDDKRHYRLLVSNKIGDGISGTVYFNVTGSMVLYRQYLCQIIFTNNKKCLKQVFFSFDVNFKFY